MLKDCELFLIFWILFLLVFILYLLQREPIEPSVVVELHLLVLELGHGLLQIMIYFWKNILGEKLIHLDLGPLHKCDGPNIPHAELGALLEAVDRFVFPNQFFSQPLDLGSQLFILILQVFDSEAALAEARYDDLCLCYDIHNGWLDAPAVAIVAVHQIIKCGQFIGVKLNESRRLLLQAILDMAEQISPCDLLLLELVAEPADARTICILACVLSYKIVLLL